MGFLRMLARGLRLRCPSCGAGRIFRSAFVENRACPACARVWLRDDGDWTGGAEITLLLVSGLLVGVLVAMRRWWPDAQMHAQLGALLLAASVLVPVTYRHVKGGWLALLVKWEGEDPRPAKPREPPEWFLEHWERERHLPQWEEPRPYDLPPRR